MKAAHRFTSLWFLTFLLATCITAVPAFAQVDLVEVGHIQDLVHSPDIFGGTGIVRARRLAIRDNRLYVANDYNGLHIYSLAQPTAPTLISDQTNHVPASSFSLSGQYAYLANYYYGFSICDISYPDHPLSLWSTPATQLPNCSDVSVSDGRAYVATLDGFSIFSVTNPAAPVLLSQIYLSNYPTGITLSGKYAYVMTSLGGVHVFDVSNPGHPIGISHLNSSGPVEGGERMIIRGRYAYMANGYDGLRILDIANPLHPISISQELTGSYTSGLALDGNRLWLVDLNYGVFLYDISNPFHPVRLAAAIATGSANEPQGHDVAIFGNYAYVANGFDGIRIYKVVPAPTRRPPANDNFSAAAPIRGPYAFITATNTFATREAFDPPIAGDTSGHSLWWTWNSNSSRTTVINLWRTTPQYPMAVYGLIPGKGFTKVVEGHDGLSFRTYPNSRYWLVVGSAQGATGTIELVYNQFSF